MSKKPNKIVTYFLEQRYQNKILLEKEESGVLDFDRKKKAPSNVREKLGQGLMDLADKSGYTDWAYENMPGVKGMAQGEVPMARQNPKKYDQLRSELAREIVLARKTKFDEGDKNPDETELLFNAISKNNHLAGVLTRDEYISLAGDITNPLDILPPEVTDSSGKQFSDINKGIVLPKWAGIEGSSALLYDFLQGANDSLTTPEGLAMTAAGGAAFKGAGALMKVGGKVVSPIVAKLAPSAVKYLPSAQTVTNLAGLGVLGYGGYDAYQQGKLPRFAGEVAGGIPGFRAGEAGAGIVGRGAKTVGKTATKKIAQGAEVLADVASDFIATQQSPEGFVSQAKQLPAWVQKLIAPEITFRSHVEPGPWQNLSPKEQMAAWKKGQGTWTPGEPFELYYKPVQSPYTVAPGRQPSAAQKVAAATAALVVGAAEPAGLSTLTVPPRPAGIVEVMPAETGQKANVVRGEVVKPLKTKSSRTNVSGVDRTSSTENKPITGKDTTPLNARLTTPAKTPAQISAQATDQAPDQLKLKNQDPIINQDKISYKQKQGEEGGGDGGGGGKKRGGDDPVKPRETPPEKAVGVPLGLPIPGFGTGSNKDLEELLKRGQLSQGDVDAILANLFQTAQTIRIA